MAVKMDTHIHTSFSTDSETDMQEQILTSYKKGLEGICITDHMDYNFPESALEHPVDGIPFWTVFAFLNDFLVEYWIFIT